MMNKNFTRLTTILLFVAGATSTVSAQYLKVGNNPFGINSSAALEIDTYSAPESGKPAARGFLPPRMTTVEREGILKSNASGSISNAAEGLVVYDTTKDALMVNTGSRIKADGTTEVPNWKTTSAIGVTKYKKVVAATGANPVTSYTMALDDYTILGDASAGPLTLTLTPVPSSGRVLVVGKSDFSGNNVTFSPALKLPVGGTGGKDTTSDMTFLDHPKTYTIQSNGTNWVIIGGF